MIRWWTFLLLCTFACGGDDRRGDGGPITRVDSGVDDGRPDAGVEEITCETPYANLVTLQQENPADMILPRCANATAQCAVDCEDDIDCFDACLLSDPTPPLSVGTNTLNCDDCYTLQTLACLDNFCGAQFAPLRCCLEDNNCDSAECPACATEFAAFVTCRDGDNVMCGDYVVPCFAN